MEYTRDDLESIKDYLSAPPGAPPAEVFATMFALRGQGEIVASTAAMRETDQGTTWRVAWLSESGITYAEVSSSRRDWTFGDPHLKEEDGELANVSAWTAGLSDVGYLEVIAVTATPGFGTSWSAETHTAVRMRDGRAFTVPLFEKFADRFEREQCERFVSDLQAALAKARG
jgi:hypothetical protein